RFGLGLGRDVRLADRGLVQDACLEQLVLEKRDTVRLVLDPRGAAGGRVAVQPRDQRLQHERAALTAAGGRAALEGKPAGDRGSAVHDFAGDAERLAAVDYMALAVLRARGR